MDVVGEVGRNVAWDGFVAVIVLVDVIGTPRGDPLLAGFVGLQRTETRSIKIYKSTYVIVHYYRLSK